ncbi:unnamed protein product [Jaminaea pallidilutea]
MADWRELLDHGELFADKGEQVADLSFSPLDIIATRDMEAIEHYNGTVRIDSDEEAELTIEGNDIVILGTHASTEPTDDGYTDWKHFDSPVSDIASTATEKQAATAQLELTPSVKSALDGPNAAHWKEAICKEISGLNAMGTWEIVDVPTTGRLVDSKLVLRIKTAPDGTPVKYKARLVARGFTQQQGIDFEETFSPVAPYTAIRVVFALAATHGWHLHTTDFTQAYLNGKLEHEIYMKPPAGAELPDGKVYRIVKGLYGLKQSGRVWNQHLDQTLRQLGFMPLSSAPCVYLKGSGNDVVIMVTYVDDIAMTSPNEEQLVAVKRSLLDKFQMEDKGEITSFCGIQVNYDRHQRTLRLSQLPYIEAMLAKFLPSGGTSKTPLDGIPAEDDPAPHIRTQYQQIVGKIMWLANHTCPDLAFAASVLARYMSTPTMRAFEAAMRCLRYVNLTKDLSLLYSPSDAADNLNQAYSDANWASDNTVKRKSTSGAALYLFGCLVSWRTQIQRCVSLSAVEAELVSASEASRELLFIKHLVENMSITPNTRLLTDSMGCIQVAKDPAQHWRLKHIDTRYNFLRDHVQEGDIDIQYIPSELNPADILTKPVGHHILTRHRSTLGLIRPTQQ